MPLVIEKVLPMSPVHLLPMSPVYTRGRRRGGQFRLALAIASLAGMTPELCSELVGHYTRVAFLQFVGEFERHSAKLALYVSGHVGQFTAQEDAERFALEMGKKWVDEHGTV